MCGGVIFPYKKEYGETLAQYYSQAEIAEFEKSGQVRSLYWQRGEPVLPVLTVSEADEAPKYELLLWGNRNKDIPLPQSGWARLNSVEEGKWSYLRPQPVLIPVTYGVEKGKWFEIEHGIKGVIAQRVHEKRVYMLTDDANEEYLAVTRHARMPVLENQSSLLWLPTDPFGTNYAQT